MTPSANTGPTAPGWIRDRIAHQERIWPFWAFVSGVGFFALLDLALGVLIWTADSVIYYARP